MKLALFFLAFSATAAWSGSTQPVSTDWFQGFNNKARLVAGHAVRDGRQGLYAGVEIEMPSGWDTYWRSPGDAGGVAPEFDWQGSENLDSAHALYPAPQRLHTKAGDVVGYTDRVLFPISVTPKDASKPITLHGKIAYGVCKDICIPAEVELQITIPPGIGASETLTDVLARVPRVDARPGIDPSLANWRLDQTTGKPKLVLNVATISPDQRRCLRRGTRRRLRAIAEARCRRCRKGRVRGRFDRRRRSQGFEGQTADGDDDRRQGPIRDDNYT